MSNKEFGSDFHYLEEDGFNPEYSFFSREDVSLFFSGRVAIFNLLKYGINKFGWEKVGFPSYYCHEVVEFCKSLPIEVIYYKYSPFRDIGIIEWEDNEKNVFVNVDYFGVKKIDTSFIVKSILIDDLTFNMLSFESSLADYCFGSVRKQLPTGVGGFCFGRKEKLKIASATNTFADRIGMQKLSAMFLKFEFLQNRFQHKEIFRTLYVEAEHCFESEETDAKMPEVVKGLLTSLPYENLIRRTRDNIKFAKTKLNLKRCRLFDSTDNTEFSLLFIFEEEGLRNEFKKYLIERKVYPSILWPSQIFDDDIYFEKRVLFIHADFRYNLEDIMYMMSIVNYFFSNV